MVGAAYYVGTGGGNSGNMVGNNKARAGNSIRRSQAKRGAEQIGGGGGYGGHFRAVQGFRYYGKAGLDA